MERRIALSEGEVKRIFGKEGRRLVGPTARRRDAGAWRRASGSLREGIAKRELRDESERRAGISQKRRWCPQILTDSHR